MPGDVDLIFRTFMDESPLSAWVVDGDDRLIYSSEPFPLTDSQLGASMWDMLPARYAAPFRAALQEARSSGTTQMVTSPGPRSGVDAEGDGWFQAYYFPLPSRWVGGVGLDVTDLVETREELARSRQRIVVAGDEARRRIERDLHDGVQQTLLVQLMRLRVARQRIERDPAVAADLIDESLRGLEEAVGELRELARGIHPSTLTRFGLRRALEVLADRAPLPVHLSYDVSGRLPEAVEVGAYFLCAEALTNVAKHAQASSAHLTVSSSDELVSVEVRDDGAGGVREQRGGGVEGLRDRIEALGGSFAVADGAGGGTVLRATLPRTPPAAS